MCFNLGWDNRIQQICLAWIILWEFKKIFGCLRVFLWYNIIDFLCGEYKEWSEIIYVSEEESDFRINHMYNRCIFVDWQFVIIRDASVWKSGKLASD